MQVLIAKFDCLYPEGMPSVKRGKILRGILDSLRVRLKCSVECVTEQSSIVGDFAVGISLVLPGSSSQGGGESEFSEQVVDLIQRKGDVEVQDYLCTVVNFEDLVDQEDLITVH